MNDNVIINMMENISDKLDNITGLLKKIESNTSGVEHNTGDIYYAKSELEDIHTTLKKKLNK